MRFSWESGRVMRGSEKSRIEPLCVAAPKRRPRRARVDPRALEARLAPLPPSGIELGTLRQAAERSRRDARHQCAQMTGEMAINIRR